MIDVHGLLGSPGNRGDLGSWGVEGYAPFCEYLARVSGGDESVRAPKEAWIAPSRQRPRGLWSLSAPPESDAGA
jgi:hypothetical protein